MNDNKEAAQTLREAAEYIGEHGWTQGRLSNMDGEVCAIGAIQRVAGSHCVVAYDAVDALWDYLNLAEPTGVLHPVAKWNDAPERSVEDVILAMKRCAEEIDNG